MADFRLRQLIQQKLEQGEPLTPEEQAEDERMAAEASPSALGSLQNKAAPELSPRPAQTLPPIAPRKAAPTPAKAPEVTPSAPASKPADEGYKPRPFKDVHQEVANYRKDMDPEVQSKFDREYSSLENMRQQAIGAYKADRKAADWGRFAEMLSRALLKMAAGYAGLKSGVDLTGAVDAGEKWDWKQDYDNMKEDLRTQLDGIGESRKHVDKKEERSYRAGEEATSAGRKEISSKEDDERTRLMNADKNASDSKKDAKQEKKEQDREDRFYAGKSLEAVQKELDALNSARAGISKKGKLSRDALATDLAGFGIDISQIPEAKGTFWGTKGSDSVDANELNKVLVAHENKLKQRQSELLSGKGSALSASPPNTATNPPPSGEEERVDPKTGKTAIFKNKQFVRWKTP